MSEPNDAARRRQFRVPYVVEVSAESDHNFWTGFTHNLSEGGLFLATPREVPLGSVVQFELRLPGMTKSWLVKTEVRWVRGPEAASEEAPAGIGLAFVELDPDLEVQINKFVSSQRESLFFDDDV